MKIWLLKLLLTISNPTFTNILGILYRCEISLNTLGIFFKITSTWHQAYRSVDVKTLTSIWHHTLMPFWPAKCCFEVNVRCRFDIKVVNWHQINLHDVFLYVVLTSRCPLANVTIQSSILTHYGYISQDKNRWKNKP